MCGDRKSDDHGGRGSAADGYHLRVRMQCLAMLLSRNHHQHTLTHTQKLMLAASQARLAGLPIPPMVDGRRSPAGWGSKPFDLRGTRHSSLARTTAFEWFAVCLDPGPEERPEPSRMRSREPLLPCRARLLLLAIVKAAGMGRAFRTTMRSIAAARIDADDVAGRTKSDDGRQDLSASSSVRTISAKSGTRQQST